MSETILVKHPWPLWRKIIFRFFFIYLMLHVAPWTWIDGIPGVSFVTKYYYQATDWAVNAANQHLFHIREQLVPVNGSGDTSYGWAQVSLYLVLAAFGCIAWSLIDHGRRSYDTADYWLRTFVRYFIATQAFTYGIIKIFALQMYFPNISQLATPLGDFLPMRFSWLFIGYSTQYQVFSGIMETLAGVMLLNRRTVTLGLLLATGVFANVVLLNLSYDIPVKIFSMHILLYCFYLLAYDAKRLASFFILNKSVPGTHLYEVKFPKRWRRISRVVFKIVFILLAVVLPLINSYETYSSLQVAKPVVKPFVPALYDVRYYVVNRDTLAPLLTDTLRWRDVVFEEGFGSVSSMDTVFRKRYGRGYFLFSADTVHKKIEFKKTRLNNSPLSMFSLYYYSPDPKSIALYGWIRNDFVHIGLVRSKHHFQLTERQFHWLSEYNR